MAPSRIKLAHIGGGSRYWARELLSELAQSAHLSGQVDLYDVDLPAAQKNVAVGEAIFSRPEARAKFKVRAVANLRVALKNADIVVLSIEPGPTTARYADLVIPAKYGVVQPVGDTTGPGGIARGLRSIEIYTGFARAIAEVCPKAWVINYTNPMTLCTAALYAEAPGIKAFGCCHEVFHTQEKLAGFVAQWFGVERPDRREISLNLSGINHFTWATTAQWKGHDLFPHLRTLVDLPGTFRSRAARARANKHAEKWFTSEGLVALDLFQRFGALGAAGDRHLAEFVPWYAREERELHRWGVVLTPYHWRLHRSGSRDRRIADYAAQPLTPSLEEGVRLMEALVGAVPIDTNVNLPNTGQAPDLDPGHIVETNAEFRRDAVKAKKSAPLPSGALALVQRVIRVQRLTLESARSRDVDGVFQAMLADPLMNIPTDRAWRMYREMLAYMKPQLPGWKLPSSR